MTCYAFELVLEPVEDIEFLVDALYEAGCNDVTVAENGAVPVLMFDREAESLADALQNAVSEVKSLGYRAVRATPDDLVCASDIARRSHKSREMVRRWIHGERVRGGFPPPIAALDSRMLWSWVEVAAWLTNSGFMKDDMMAEAKALAAFNRRLASKRRVA